MCLSGNRLLVAIHRLSDGDGAGNDGHVERPGCTPRTTAGAKGNTESRLQIFFQGLDGYVGCLNLRTQL